MIKISPNGMIFKSAVKKKEKFSFPLVSEKSDAIVRKTVNLPI